MRGYTPGSGNNSNLTRVGGLTLPGVFTREKVVVEIVVVIAVTNQ